MENFITELNLLPKNIYAAIEASRTIKSKYFLLRQKIYESTKFLPIEFKVGDRIYCLINNITTWPKLCGCGCGGQVSAPHRNYLPSHGNKSEKVKNKKKEVFQQKYGVDNCSQIEEIKKKKEATYNKSHDSKIIFKKDKNKIIKEKKLIKKKIINYKFENNTDCKKEIINYIKSLNKSINDSELYDIFINNSLAINILNENHYEDNLLEKLKTKSIRNYHLLKIKNCEENIKLIHIFQDEWILKKQIVKSRIKTILKCQKYNINARECIIKEINSRLCNKFLDKYHLQGKDNSNTRLGLFYKNRLVAVMTFCKPRIIMGQKNNKEGYELSRFATVSNFSIRGGASKLLSYFEKTYKPNKLITYADRRWSEGNLYYKLGFTLDHISPPSYFYIHPLNPIKRLYRWAFRKSELPKKLGENIDMSKTESELMKEAGYNKIWDCGNLVFQKDYN